MNSAPVETAALPRWMRPWERFWFTPMDPTPLAFIRIMCGLIVLYTFSVYSFCLQEMMGPDAWVDLQLRESVAHDQPLLAVPLGGGNALVPPATAAQRYYLEQYRLWKGWDVRLLGLSLPENDQQWNYLVAYTRLWDAPPPAYVESDAEANFVNEFRETYKADPRANGLKLPQTEFEHKYLVEYTKKWGTPPPAYARDEDEASTINAYIARERIDPRNLYTHGTPIWSVWLHVIDPRWMAWVQAGCVLSALLLTLGLGTRVTAALTWFASLSYIHRNVQVMFGVDTMMNILLLYLMIGPSGAALSLDRLVLRWWRGQTTLPPPAPRVSANVAIRLLQIHICIIYLVAGLAKLQGNAWWNGIAMWGVLGNYEFAPMHIGLYNDVMRYVCRSQVRFEVLMTASCYFTLLFEIGYCFLIWWPRTRWVYLSGAILLHGTIGLFMGLKTFSMIMLVMNMAFLRPEEIRWMLGWFRRQATTAPPAVALEAVTSVSGTPLAG